MFYVVFECLCVVSLVFYVVYLCFVEDDVILINLLECFFLVKSGLVESCFIKGMWLCMVDLM